MLSESLAEYNERSAEILSLREANLKLAQSLREAKARSDRLVEATLQGAMNAMVALGPVPVVKAPTKDRRVSVDGEVALWHMTDWQGAKLTTSYNSEVMQDRVMQFVTKAARITEIQRADHPVRKAVIAFGGDMIEGLFNFPTQAHEIDQTIFGQYTTVARLIVDVITYALTIYEEVEIVSEWGNHGRMGSKRDVVPRSDNLDRMTYELARQLLAGNPRVTWSNAHGIEDIQRLEIGNYRALVIHGDEIGRGGFASPMQIVAHVNRWKSGAYPWDFRDCYVGHYHNHMELSTADGVGAVYWTGSTESDNRYARETMAASAQPSQRLHFVNPDKGLVTAQYKVFLD